MCLANFLCRPSRAGRMVLITGHFCLILTRAGGACLSELAEAAESGGCFQHRRLARPLRSGLSQVRSLSPGGPVTNNPLSQDHPMRHTGRELMKMPLLLLIGCAALATRGENLPERRLRRADCHSARLRSVSSSQARRRTYLPRAALCRQGALPGQHGGDLHPQRLPGDGPS